MIRDIPSRRVADRPPESKAKSPSSRMADHFEKEWARVRTAASGQFVAGAPWSMGNKQRFYGWVNRSFLPAVGSEDSCRELFTMWCDQLIAREIPMPDTGRTEVYWLFSRDLDRLRTIQARSAVRAVSDHDEFLAEQAAAQKARAERMAAAAQPDLRVVGE